MGSRRRTHVSKLAVRLVIGLGVLLALWACPADASWDSQYDSVHFHDYAIDFGTPPRRTFYDWRDSEITDRAEEKKYDTSAILMSAATRQGYEDSPGMDREEARKTKGADLLIIARIAEKQGQWRKARSLYERCASILAWTGDLKDRIEILRRVEARKTPLPAGIAVALQTYLQGMALVDDGARADAETSFNAVYDDPNADFLKDRALYQRASVAYVWLDFAHAITLYQTLLRDFPKTARREEALIMIARSCILPQVTESRRLAVGQAALDQLLKEFPKTRFRRSVVGLKGRIHFLKRLYAEALQCYFVVGDLESAQIVYKAMPPEQKSGAQLHLLEAYLKRLTSNNEDESETTYEINRLRKEISPTEAARFAQDLVRRPDLLAPYFYYRLYYCANTLSDLKHLTQLADTVVGRYPNTTLSPAVRVRLAEIYYQQKQYDKAVSWTSRALASYPSYDRALYVRAASEYKLKRFQAAINDLRALLKSSVDGGMRHGAREELALAYEATGEMGAALDQYLALDYRTDVAYLLDVRMTPAQIETYLHYMPALRYMPAERMRDDDESSVSGVSKPYTFTRHQLLAYTLGIRYLREEKWDQAERWLKQVPRSVRDRFDAGRHEMARRESPDSLTAARELSRLQGTIKRARTSAARASAMYRYASYYYSHGTLLLYNPTLWHGNRAFNFCIFWHKKQETPQDILAVQAYMYQHEVYYRVRELCLQIARQYPRSPTAPKAFYRAACASYYLANFNYWWRDEENKRHNNWDQAVRLMREVVRRYPKSSLATDARKFAGVFKEEKKEYVWDRE